MSRKARRCFRVWMMTESRSDPMCDGPTWTDTHCHLQLIESEFDDDEMLGDARRHGVGNIICVGIDVVSSERAIEVAAVHDRTYPTVGLHPHEAKYLDRDWPRIERLARIDSVVAIGECGLDFFRDHSSRDAQDAAFRAQIELSRALDLPLIVHTRDAWDACFAVLDDEGPPDRLVFHCFSGGRDEAAKCVDLGAMVSFAGPIGYPRNEALRDAARSVPLESIVVETDAPYLSPQGFRGKTNFPARVALVGETLAAVLERSADDVARVTSENARRLFELGS